MGLASSSAELGFGELTYLLHTSPVSPLDPVGHSGKVFSGQWQVSPAE